MYAREHFFLISLVKFILSAYLCNLKLHNLMGGRKDIFKFKQFTIHQGNAGMKVGTDSDLLGALATVGNNVLDIGTGTGVLSLMMAQRNPEAKITAIEIDDDAVKDASLNFSESVFSDRITLHHTAFQDYVAKMRDEHSTGLFDCVICNPPYFHKSMECPDNRRLRARHTSSLPFEDLIGGAYELLAEGGSFSVCLPPEVYSIFCEECLKVGFVLQDIYSIKSVPELPTKRYILVHRKSRSCDVNRYEYCMRNSDRTVSDWYKSLMQDYLL